VPPLPIVGSASGQRAAGGLWLRALPVLGLDPGQRVLGVAMAGEPALGELARRGVEVVACDWHAAALGAGLAGGLPAAGLVPWEAAAPPALPGRAFDVACCDLAHLPGRAAFADAVRCGLGALHPGGRLLVCGAHAEGVGGAASRLRDWTGAAQPVAYGDGRRILQSPAVPSDRVPEPTAPVPREVAIGGVTLLLQPAEAVFARGLPDAATRLLAEVAGQWAPGCARLCDVGCGGGALGLCLLRRGAGLCTGVDENLRALHAAARNAAANGLQGRWQACGRDATAGISGRYDLVVCNPPLHRGPHEDRGLGRAVVRAAWAACAPGGRFCVVAHGFLRPERDVPELRAVRADASFRVLSARRP